jgi:hypothetical protein
MSDLYSKRTDLAGRRTIAILAAAACLELLGSGPTWAQAATAKQAAAAPIPPAALKTPGPGGKLVPNFSGLWYPDASIAGTNGPNDQNPTRRGRKWSAFNGYSTLGNTPPPLSEEGEKKLAEAKAKMPTTGPMAGLDEEELKCRAGLFWSYYAYNEVWDVFQRPDELEMINKRQRAFPRTILIGRKQPAEEDLEYTPNGHAVAHWEGNVLVVDTIGTTDNTWLTRRDRLPHSKKLHIVERFSMSPDGYTLTDQAVIEDPEFLAKPWPVTLKFRRAKPGVEPIDEECNVDEQNPYK